MPTSLRPLIRTRFGLLVILSAVFLLIQAVVRIALSIYSGASLAQVIPILAVGFIADLYPLVMAVGGGAVALAVPPSLLWRTRWYPRFLIVASGIATTLMLVVAVAEWLFWAEFGSRFNFLAVEYLIYSDEVAKNILESYSVGWMLAAMAAAAMLLLWLIRRPLAISLGADSPPRTRLATVAACLAAAGLAAVAPAPELGSDRRARELSRNGIYQFVSAFRTNQIDYEQFYITRPIDAVLPAVRRRLEPPSVDTFGVARAVSSTAPERRLNVVMIVVESLSASYLHSFGSSYRLTPRLDALAAQSLWFSNVYATGTRTVRGLEALTLSIPPTPGHSILKRPGGEGLQTIGTPFLARGYDAAFLYGGFGYFDNMNAFFGSAGFRVVDRASLSRSEVTFSNAWGVADEDLFRRVMREADADWAKQQPFMMLALTTSNHRPYTFPEGRIANPQGIRESAVAYTDWAIGRFIDDARGRPWFKDTIVVVVADHCAAGSGETELPIAHFRIPLLIYAPGIVQPREVTHLASQIDVAPTLLNLLGFSYTSSFFGRDMLSPGDERAFLGTYESLGYFHDGQLTILQPHQRALAYNVTGDHEVERAVDAGERDVTVDYYQGAAEVFRRGALKLGATGGYAAGSSPLSSSDAAPATR